MDIRNGFPLMAPLFALGFCFVLPSGIDAADETPNIEKPWQCTLRLLDPDGKPVAGGKVTTYQNVKEWPPEVPVREIYAPVDPREYVSDEEGHVTIRYCKTPAKTLYVDVYADGFVPLQYVFGDAHWPEADLDIDEIPRAFDVPLSPGIPACGVVRDANGKPIEGAAVVVIIPDCADEAAGTPEPLEERFIVLRTDADGKWACRVPPPGEEMLEWSQQDLNDDDVSMIAEWLNHGIESAPLGVQAAVAVGHSDYAPKRVYCLRKEFSTLFNPHKELLQAIKSANCVTGTTVDTVLKDGVHLGGNVVDESGEPIEAVRVVLKVEKDEIPSIATAQSGKSGRFDVRLAVRHLLEEPPVLFAYRDGYAPCIRRLKPGAADDPQRLVLKKAEHIKLTIRDSSGRAVVARVSVCDELDEPLSDPLNLPGETDIAGTWSWNSAPAEACAYRILAKGFEGFRRELPPGEHTISLKRPFRVIGRVVDAETGAPIKRLFVSRKKVLNDDDPTSDDEIASFDRFWHNIFVADSPDGTFECVCASATLDAINWYLPDGSRAAAAPRPDYTGVILRIEAEGYAPVVTKTLPWKEGVTELTLRMKKAQPLTGRIVNTRGRPVAGAEVVVAGKDLAPVEMAPFELFAEVIGPFAESVWASQEKFCEDEMDVDRCLRFYTFFDREDEIPKQPRHARTGPDGRFTLFPQKAPYELVVAHQSGFAHIPSDAFKPGSDIVLEPWASIEGVVEVDGEPLPHVHIRIDPAPCPGTKAFRCNSSIVETSARGKFRFDGLPATKVTIVQVIYDEFDFEAPTVLRESLKSIPLKTVVLSPGEFREIRVHGKVEEAEKED